MTKMILKDKYNGVDSPFKENLWKYTEFLSWARWYPDLFLDLCRPQSGGINLCLDQRVFMRSLVRFGSVYGCLPRGSAKTFMGVTMLYVVAILFPGVTLSLSAQTKDNAIALLRDKHNEIMGFWPLLANELKEEPRFTTANNAVKFKNGSRIDALANSQNSKGQRRNRLNMEEDALVDHETYEDALLPIVEVPRTTKGKMAIVNPLEMNQQIHFFTTPGWRGSEAYNHNVAIGRKMVDLDGGMTLGADWMLPCWYGRGSTKRQILDKMGEMSPIAFDQNYGGRWTGSSSNALVNINALMACRTLNAPVFEYEKISDEYYFGVDVARSENKMNNQSSVAVIKVVRNKEDDRIMHMDLVNMFHIPNYISYTKQAIRVKKLAERYNPKMVVCDGNGLGSGLIDELLKINIDRETGKEYRSWNTANTENEPEERDAPEIVYDLKSSGCNNKIISTFMDVIEARKLRLLRRQTEVEISLTNEKDYEKDVVPFVETDRFFEEVANLKVKTQEKALKLEKVVSKIDKDRYAACAYCLYYIVEFKSARIQSRTISEGTKTFEFKSPKFLGGKNGRKFF